MFRSEDMTLNKLMFTKESMWDTMNFLAKTQKVMMSTNHKNPYKKSENSLSLYAAKTIKRCEDLIEKIKDIKKKMIDFDWPLSSLYKSNLDYFNDIDKFCESKEKEGFLLFQEEELFLTEKHKELNEHINIYDSIITQLIRNLEKKQCYGFIEELIPLYMHDNLSLISSSSLSNSSYNTNKKIQTVIGLIPTKNLMNLQKILFRISRENIIMKSKNLENIDDIFLKDKIIEERTLIFILFPSTDTEYIIQKVNTMLNHYEFYPIDIPKARQKNEKYLQIRNELEDNKIILEETKNKINLILENFSSPKYIPQLSYIHFLNFIVQREMSFSKNLIFIEEKDGFNQLLFWTPKDYSEKLSEDIKQIKKNDTSFIPPKIESFPNFQNKTPPSSFKTNDFSKSFQLIVDTYGIPRYKESNPGLFTIISFPFLFGIMFGDIGHGAIVLCFGLYLIFGLKDKLNPMYDLRYLIFLMGFFACYCGFVYNEFFAIPFTIQPSCWVRDGDKFLKKEGCNYGFGLDWVWAQSQNETSFINSFKMKFSIIIGVIQMLFGIFLKGANGYHFNSYIDIFFEAVPQFIFMSVTFGYMSFCIILKWLTNWDKNPNPVSIIQLFINFFTVEEPLFGDGILQAQLQFWFAITCLICMILMLFPKPYLMHLKNKKKKIKKQQKTELETNLIQNTTSESSHNHEDEEFSDLFVHQMIETIEFVLGSISNTASYLRLWALSLAHGQLAKVFLDMIFGWTIQNSDNFFISTIVIVIGFVFFLFVTFAVILVMDTMECFLHALRLHWVEFQNKFFKGDGIPFEPFTQCEIEH